MSGEDATTLCIGIVLRDYEDMAYKYIETKRLCVRKYFLKTMQKGVIQVCVCCLSVAS